MNSRIIRTARFAPRRLSTRASPTLVTSATFKRHNSTAPPPEKGSNTLLYAAIAAAVAGGAYYYMSDSAPSTTSAAKTPKDYQEVYNAIADILEDNDYDDGSYAPVILRLAWHASGTFDKNTKTGGSNGATMRFPIEAGHGANAGLAAARDRLEPIKKKFPWISYSDLWTLAGVASVQEMGGPIIPWRPGRQDADVSATTPDGRLPDAAQGSQHVRDIFYRMGFDDQEIVALLGAHALGRCHTDRSGFEGPWTFSPITFTNDFYTLLFDEKWQWKKWKGPAQYEDVKTKTLMMLPTDYTVVTDKSFSKYGKEYAKDQDKFFKDFASSFKKLLELGVPEAQMGANINFRKTEDQ